MAQLSGVRAWPLKAAATKNGPQQEVLRHAMAVMGMTRLEFAARLGVPVRTFDKWLLPVESSDHREMPGMAHAYIADLLHWHRVAARNPRGTYK